MNEDDCYYVTRQMMSFLRRATTAVRDYRRGRGLHKGEEVNAIATDYWRWCCMEESSLMTYKRPAFREKVMKLMRLMDEMTDRKRMNNES